VAQRSSESSGDIVITGTTNSTATIEARFNGGSWVTIATGVSGAWSGTLTGQTPAQGVLEVRRTDTLYTVTIPYVGLGDVFIIAGQSNASGRGTSSQVYSGSPRPTIFTNAYLWKELRDPTDSGSGQVDTVSDDTANNPSGSVWPLLATSFLASQSVPCAFVPCAFGGSGIVSWLPGANHQDRTTLYGSMIYRALQTGAKCILWWQGETDAVAGMSQATYNGHLDTIANAINADLGVKLMPCKLQTFSAATGPQQAAINAAIAEAWGDNTNVLTGPDLTGLTADDTFHLKSNANLSAAAALWWTSLQGAFGYA
jgi:hypothetical protein